MSTSLWPCDYSPPISSVPGILQAGILEWVAMSFSRDLSHPGIGRASPQSPALAGGFFTTRTIWEGQLVIYKKDKTLGLSGDYSRIANLVQHSKPVTIVKLPCAKSLQLCLTLCDPMVHSPSGSSVHGILHARIQSRLPFPPSWDIPYPGI